MLQDKICLITFSNNADHQNVVYSMFRALQGKADVYTIGIQNPKSDAAAYTDKNWYYRCPLRPGIERDTFRLSALMAMANRIRKEEIRYLYFESQHLWNAALMLLCPQCIRIQAVHDVIPHDGNRAMDLSNFVTSHLADHVVLRNVLYREALSKRCRIPLEKITCFALWRQYPKEVSAVHSGIFLSFGRIRRYKGFDKLVQIVAQTPEISYRIVGEPDEESRPLVEELKAFPNATVIDEEISDAHMTEELCGADWLVLPYTEATQSGVIVDAYRHSRPVIAFDVGAISEQIEDGVTGFLVPEGDVQKFVEAVRKAAAMKSDALDAFTNAAYQFGYHHYSADAVAERFLNVVVGVKK